MARRIPPLNPLHVFEVVARTLNLTAAARELHVTQSAVSRQVGALESYLGVELFRRERHGVVLTRAGQTYAEQIGPAFDAIASATDTLTKATGSWSFTYNRSVASRPPGTTQIVEYGDNLTGWTQLIIPAGSASNVTITPQGDTDRVEVTLPVLGPAGFARLKVTQ